MSEEDWLDQSDPVALMTWLDRQMKTTQRKLQLFVCAACRQIQREIRPAVHRLIDAAERAAEQPFRPRGPTMHSSSYHDALLSLWRETLTELEAEVRTLTSWVMHGVSRGRDAAIAVRALCPPASLESQAAIVRELFGNPLHPVREVGSVLHSRLQYWTEEKKRSSIFFVRDWRFWEGGIVTKLAEGIAKDKAFDRMPYLADALEDAGCDERRILDHCREKGQHLPGCWVLDLVLDRR
jgi:hypothetical protein